VASQLYIHPKKLWVLKNYVEWDNQKVDVISSEEILTSVHFMIPRFFSTCSYCRPQIIWNMWLRSLFGTYTIVVEQSLESAAGTATNVLQDQTDYKILSSVCFCGKAVLPHYTAASMLCFHHIPLRFAQLHCSTTKVKYVHKKEIMFSHCTR